MSAYAFYRKKTRSLVLLIAPWVLAAGALSAGGWAIVNGAENHARGSYAGYYYGDGLAEAESVLSQAVGLQQTLLFRFPKTAPNVVNTHLGGAFSNDQIRVFHFIGPKGVKWCVGVWHHRGTQNSQVVKGCRFNAPIAGLH